MTEIQKTRERKTPGEWQRWLTFGVAMGLLFLAMISSAWQNHQLGVVACIFLSVLSYLEFYHFSDRRLHKELVQEIDGLRRELEQFKAASLK